MKKFKLIFGIAAMVSIVGYISYGCKDKDKFPPKIYLIGGDAVFTELGKAYNDSGAIAEDNLDKTITSSIITGHDIPKKYVSGSDSITTKIGPYTFTYSATDKAGNTKSATRSVTVRNYAWPYALQYSLSRKNVSHPTDSTINANSIGCQYARFKYRKVPQKMNVTVDKSINRQILLPIGGELQIKVDATFVDNVHIRIDRQDVVGQRGFVLDYVNGSYVSKRPVKYRVTGLSTTSTSNDRAASMVTDTTKGRRKIVVKYSISKFDTITGLIKPETYIYADTLTQIW